MVDYEMLLRDIEQYWLEHGFPPTVRFLQMKWNLGSTATVIYRVERMSIMGMLRRSGGMIVPKKMLERAQRALRTEAYVAHQS